VAQATARRFYPNPATDSDYTAVINDSHYQRLCSFVNAISAG
jgi:hypothetical protein